MSCRLHWTDERGKECSLDVEDRVFIGRICQGVPEGKRIVLADPHVSKDHAVVSRAGNRLSICDSSSNGTFINGLRLTTGVERALHNGDVITVGERKIDIVTDEAKMSERSSSSMNKTVLHNVQQIVTHLVGDVRGYSTASQQHSSTDIYDVMKEIFGDLSRVVHRHSGVLMDFAGDSIFAIWEHGGEEKSDAAVACCRAALDQLDTLEESLGKLPEKYEELSHLRMGWGISTGPVTFSHFGVQKNSLAVVGDSTNLAFRLSDLANKSLESPIVICSRTADLVEENLLVRELGGVMTKGRVGEEKVFGLGGAGGDDQYSL